MFMDFTAAGRVTEDGRLELDDRASFARAMRTFKPGRVSVRVEIDRGHRSNKANRYYRGVVLHLISEHTGDEPNDLHDWFKRRFLQPVVRRVFGEEVQIWTTTGLNSQAFHDYVEQVRRFALVELGIETPDADPGYRLARARKRKVAA